MIKSALAGFIRTRINGICISFHGGIGDQILLTAVARELATRGRQNVFVQTKHPELFTNNQDIRFAFRPELQWARFLNAMIGYDRSVSLSYENWDAALDIGIPPNAPLIAIMCSMAGIRGDISLRPYLSLTRRELRNVSTFRGGLALQSSGMAAASPMLNKQWFPERFHSVIAGLKGRVQVHQIGHPSDPLVDGAVDLRGKLTLRETAAILAVSRGFLGLVGMQMHLARSVNCPAVVIYGGREKAWQSGYSCNINLESNVPCSPCWSYSRCDHSRACMREIESEHVRLAVDELLARKSSELPVDKWTIN